MPDSHPLPSGPDQVQPGSEDLIPDSGAFAGESWLTIEVDLAVLSRNIGLFRDMLDPETRLMAVVKAEAYGHGLLLSAGAFLSGGADLLGVHSLAEAQCLRQGGFQCPIIILGPVTGEQAVIAASLGVEITVGSVFAAQELLRIGADLTGTLQIHLKVESGVNRQGVTEDEIREVVGLLDQVDHLRLVGLSSHFADIEDTTDHGFARQQSQRFNNYRELLAQTGHDQLVSHMTCSAATLLWKEAHGQIARVGISAYGIWPSKETRVAMRQGELPELDLSPALTWKCRVAQVRQVPAGQTVGYGRTWKAMTDSRVAVLPVGYSDGWPRGLSGRAHVLLRGARAPLVGRVCMNLCMVDVTHIPEVQAGDQAVLLGRQGDEIITAEMLADHLGTINYEVLTLPGPTWRRVPV